MELNRINRNAAVILAACGQLKAILLSDQAHVHTYKGRGGMYCWLLIFTQFKIDTILKQIMFVFCFVSM